jgi:hypothetical protein
MEDQMSHKLNAKTAARRAAATFIAGATAAPVTAALFGSGDSTFEAVGNYYCLRSGCCVG